MDATVTLSSHSERGSVDPASSTPKGSADGILRPEGVEKMACDQCRSRKIGCDRHDPCSRCVRAQLQCGYTTRPRPRRKRARKTTASQYEAKIDALSRKLDTTCRHLEGHSGASPSEFHVSKTTSPQTLSVLGPRTFTQTSTPNTLVETSERTDEEEYEGESALSAHTAFANTLLKGISGQDVTKLLKSTPSDTSTQSTRSQVSSSPQLAMPSADMAFYALQRLKEDPSMQLPWTLEFESIDHFQEYLLRVYSSSNPTAAEQIILLAAWISILPACAFSAVDALQKTRLEAQAVLCRDSLDKAIDRLPLLYQSTFDNVLALTMASNCYMHRSRIGVAWSLNCTAARMALALGFHKASSQDSETNINTRRKARIFVIIFATSKTLSLRLGRASAIRNEETPPELELLLRGVNTAPFKIPYRWLAFSAAQGLVYDQLYSPRATQQTTEVKQSVAKALLDEVQNLTWSQSEANHWETTWADLYEAADHVSQLALTCLIYHGAAPSAFGLPFYEECIPFAREALTEHHRCFVLLSGQGRFLTELYLHWALLTSPFIPFIILLCNVTQTLNCSDLELLGTTIASIEIMRDSFPEISRQLKLFKPLYEVASNFVEAKTASVPVMGDFGTFFQESNVDTPLSPEFILASMNQRSTQAAVQNEEAYVSASILDAWGEIDQSQYAV